MAQEYKNPAFTLRMDSYAKSITVHVWKWLAFWFTLQITNERRTARIEEPGITKSKRKLDGRRERSRKGISIPSSWIKHVNLDAVLRVRIMWQLVYTAVKNLCVCETWGPMLENILAMKYPRVGEEQKEKVYGLGQRSGKQHNSNIPSRNAQQKKKTPNRSLHIILHTAASF